MNDVLRITVEQLGEALWLARVEQPGFRYEGLLDTTSATAETPQKALENLAVGVNLAEKVLAERALDERRRVSKS